MGIAEADVERVKAAVGILDVVQAHVALRRVGRRWVGLCPFHAERTPSFGINEELGRYHCFGCSASGDVITFVREIEHLDFAGAVEWLAGKAGIALTYTTGTEGRDRRRRTQLVEVMGRAVDWYHARLLEGPDARPARDYLRSRGITGDVARQFKLGWAPDAWDELVSGLHLPPDLACDTGLAFTNRRGRLQDSFRARILFPIFSDTGEPLAFGGRILPGSTDPAKYKNSPETAVYAKSKTLYGLHWAKADIVHADEVVLCEGYTDVIGFHRAGVTRAVATCGTALTEDHVRLLRRYARRLVLAFDADAAGQGAAERVYEWERRHDVEVAVVHLPPGSDPADLASSDPEALRAAVTGAEPFLGFRVHRALRAGSVATPERRARTAEVAMAILNEHPDVNVKRLYAGEVAAHCGLPVAPLVAAVEQGRRKVRVDEPVPVRAPRDGAEVVALVVLVHRWDEIAPWLVEALFVDAVNLAAFRALAEADGDVDKALEIAEPAARELLERLVVEDVDADADPELEARNLIAAATRRELARLIASGDLAVAREHAEVRSLLDRLDDPQVGPSAGEQLLRWLDRRIEERR